MEDAIKVEANSLTKVKASWRELSVDDIESLVRVADKIHPSLPESDQVFAERVRLFPEGCLALAESEGDELLGYIISHPIRRRQPPALNRLLEQIAFNADHDTRRPVSSPSTAPRLFWSRFGLVPEDIDELLEKKLLDYGDDAIYLERKNGEQASHRFEDCARGI
ncbi:MAG: hypothetical protein Q9171_000968 [Xanthocarpia ochracea]